VNRRRLHSNGSVETVRTALLGGLSPVANRQGAAAVVTAAVGRSVEFAAMRAQVVHGLAHATGMRRGGRNSQGQRGERPH